MSEHAELWICPDCAFGFDKCHSNQDGSYSCPLCGELQALSLLRAIVDEWDDSKGGALRDGTIEQARALLAKAGGVA